MKHTNYQAKISEVKALEYEELKRAVEAHGGSYDWTTHDGCSPVITINPECSEPEPVDIDVTKVVLRNGSLEIFGVDNINRKPIDFDIDDIFAGHLSIVTDYIPETDTISDVSQPVAIIPGHMAGATKTVYLTVRWDIESDNPEEITDEVVDDLIDEKDIYNHSFSANGVTINAEICGRNKEVNY